MSNHRISGIFIESINFQMQMEFLYVAVLEYLQKFDSYSCIL
jgi:hypothetical protein